MPRALTLYDEDDTMFLPWLLLLEDTLELSEQWHSLQEIRTRRLSILDQLEAEEAEEAAGDHMHAERRLWPASYPSHLYLKQNSPYMAQIIRTGGAVHTSFTSSSEPLLRPRPCRKHQSSSISEPTSGLAHISMHTAASCRCHPNPATPRHASRSLRRARQMWKKRSTTTSRWQGTSHDARPGIPSAARFCWSTAREHLPSERTDRLKPCSKAKGRPDGMIASYSSHAKQLHQEL